MNLRHQAVDISTTGARERTKQNYSKGTEHHVWSLYRQFPKQPYLWYLINQCLCKKGFFLTFHYVAAQNNYEWIFLLQASDEHCFKQASQ